MRALIKLIFICILALPAAAFSTEKGLTVKGVRYSTYAAFTRIVFEIEQAAPYVLTRSQDGRSVILAAYEGPLAVKSALPAISDAAVSGMELREEAGRTYLLLRLEGAAGEVKDFVLRGPDRIVLDINRGAAPAGVAPQDAPTVIVLDPGHGGRDPGVVTAQGPEKTVTLDLALLVRKILQKNPRLKAVLTREKDQTLSLDERAAVSNTAGAAIFVSIHAAPGTGARVFIQDLIEDAATRPVRPVSGDFLGFEAGSEQQEMVWGRQQAVHARESGGLGRRLARRLAEKDAGDAVQAPIAGLKAVDAAAVMVEVGMEHDRARTAEAIAGGIEQYVREDR